jgi:hypothetical protein
MEQFKENNQGAGIRTGRHDLLKMSGPGSVIVPKGVFFKGDYQR